MEIIGIEKEDNIIHIASVNKKINNLATFTVDEFLNVKEFYIKKWLATAISSEEVLIKQTLFKTGKSSDLKKAISFHSSSITFVKDALIFPKIVKKDKKTSTVNFFITNKKVIQNHIKEMQNIGIDPHFVSSDVLALVRFANFNLKEFNSLFLVHIGKTKTIVVFMHQNFPKNSCIINIGFDEIEQKIFALKKELGAAFSHFSREEKFPLLLSGKEVYLGNFDQVSKVIKSPTEFSKHAIAIGIALDAFKNDAKTIQFRKNELISSACLKKIARKWLSFLLLIFILSIGFYIIGNWLLTKKERKLWNLLEENKCPKLSIEKNIESLEKKINKKASFQASTVSNILSFLTSFKIEISEFKYEFAKERGKIYLLFSSTKEVAEKLRNSLPKKSEISWDSSEDNYKICFYWGNYDS